MAVETVRWRESVALPRMVAAAAHPVVRPASRAIENLVLVLFWLLIFEGSLRKWLLPEYSRWLFFVRDPFLLILYWQAARARAWRDAGPLLWAGSALAVLAVMVAFTQSISFGDPRMLPMLIYGWRQYFLYLPLPFVLAATVDRAFLVRFTRHAIAAVVLTAPLVVIEYGSPGSSVLNRGSAEDAALQFQSFDLLGEHIRPSGFFTTNIGVKELLSSTAALLFAFWLMPVAGRGMRLPWLLCGAAGVATCLALSGSRAAFVHMAIVVLAALGVGFVTRSGAVRARALTIPLLLCLAGAILYPLVFPGALQTMLERVANANAFESQHSSLGILGRALSEYVEFLQRIGTTPLLGWGLGLGGNGRTFLGDTSALPLAQIAAESEWTRHVVDLGVVGLLFILYRIVFVLVLLWRALHATRVARSPLPLMLFGYVGIVLLNGQMTGQGTVGGFAWLYVGLCMASCRVAMEER
ncbi:MAG TPA: hypothetical protein VMI92_11245 [Steroidobacteraceae bacterium]|nr:hypothetical protein [Steroidobacteraceae bacterium]